MLAVVPEEEPLAERLGILVGPEPIREVRAVLEGLELGLGEGLSLETWGQECEGTTPKVASSRAHGLRGHRWAAVGMNDELVGAMRWRSQLSAINTLARAALSWRARSQPTTYRLKMSSRT
jgi:hypothetical protein